MASTVTVETAKRLVETGLVPGSMQTEWGETIVKRGMINGNSIFTVTFPEMEEKWAVVGGDIIAAKYVPPPVGDGVTHQETATAPKPKLAGVGLTLLPAKGATKMEKKKEVKPEVKAKAKMGPKVELPRSERGKTDIAKAVKKGLPVKEQPPTRRAFIGRQPQPKVVVKKGPGGKVEKVVVPMAKPRKKQCKVEKIGAPVWRRQLNWKGEPEKVNIKEYPFKILCAKCGQPRYLDPANAHVKLHPVTLCKPHARREHDDRHNAMLRRRTAERREAALKAAKLTCKAPPNTAAKGSRSHQEPSIGSKGTKIPPKGPYKGRKARGRSEG